MGRRVGSKDRAKHDSLRFLNRYIQRVRKGRKCKDCQRTHPLGLYLAGDGITLQELARSAGASLKNVKIAIRSRGWMCRRCLNGCKERAHRKPKMDGLEEMYRDVERHQAFKESRSEESYKLWIEQMEEAYGPL